MAADDPVRFLVAGVSLVVLLGAIAFSKRGGAGMTDDLEPADPEPARHGLIC